MELGTSALFVSALFKLEDGFAAIQKSRWPSEDNHLRLFNGAAYRIRTYDLLIRSQTLYPAELMPQRAIYNAIAPRSRQEKLF